jgi:hypothetical protein
MHPLSDPAMYPLFRQAGKTAWTTVAQRQADAILVVARSQDDDPSAGT